VDVGVLVVGSLDGCGWARAAVLFGICLSVC
jgi:hypothetical protein